MMHFQYTVMKITWNVTKVIQEYGEFRKKISKRNKSSLQVREFAFLSVVEKYVPSTNKLQISSRLRWFLLVAFTKHVKLTYKQNRQRKHATQLI